MYCPSRLAGGEPTHNFTCSSSRALSACDLVLKLTNAIGCKEDHMYEHILHVCKSYVYTCMQVYIMPNIHTQILAGVMIVLISTCTATSKS